MACGGCGKRRKSIQINRPGPISVPSQKSDGRVNRAPDSGKKLCPVCRSVMRSIHRYDKSVKKVIRNWYCTKSSCPNSRG